MVDLSFAKTIGANITKYREAAGLTQAQLAEQVGVSTAFISRVERGQKMMKIERLCATAQALQVSCDALLYPDSSEARFDNIHRLLAGKSSEYVEGIEQIVRICVEKFDSK